MCHRCFVYNRFRPFGISKRQQASTSLNSGSRVSKPQQRQQASTAAVASASLHSVGKPPQRQQASAASARHSSHSTPRQRQHASAASAATATGAVWKPSAATSGWTRSVQDLQLQRPRHMPHCGGCGVWREPSHVEACGVSITCGELQRCHKRRRAAALSHPLQRFHKWQHAAALPQMAARCSSTANGSTLQLYSKWQHCHKWQHATF